MYVMLVMLFGCFIAGFSGRLSLTAQSKLAVLLAMGGTLAYFVFQGAM